MHSFHLKRTAPSEKCTGPTCKMLFYPLLAQLERWDISIRSARRLSHSEAFCATGGIVNEETASPKEHQS